MQPRFSRGTVLALAAIVLVTAVLRAPLLKVPFERDEGEYAYIGWRLGHGELPYRDWVDQKPPGIFWIYRVALSLPLEPIVAVHLMALLFSAGSACSLFFLARRFVSQFWAGAAALLFALLSAHPRVQGMAANTEIFMTLPLVLSQLAFFKAVDEITGGTPALKPWRSIAWMTLAGILTGSAVCFKQVAGINWFFQAALFSIFLPRDQRLHVFSGVLPSSAAATFDGLSALDHPTTGKRSDISAAEDGRTPLNTYQRLRQGVAFAGWSLAGAAAVWGIIAIYFQCQHALGALIENVFTHNLEYVNANPFARRLMFCRNTLADLSSSQALVWLISAAGLVALALSGRIRWLLFLGGWLATSALGVSASGYFFPHYFQQLLPPLALGAAIAAKALNGAQTSAFILHLSRRVILSVLLLILPAITIFPFLVTYSPAETIRKIYPGNLFAEMPELGRRLAQITSPEERVFVFGAEPELLFYAQRLSATRYIFLFPLYGPYRDVKEKQTATAKEVTDARPAAAVYYPLTLLKLPGTEQFFTEWTRSYLQENFRGEAYFTVDESGAGHLVPVIGGREPILPAGQKIMATVLARKDR
jgi:hypothetical protein